MHVRGALESAVPRLAAHSQSPVLDAQVLLAHVLERPRSWVIAHPEFELPIEVESTYEQALRRMALGEPLPYVLGHWEFYDLDLLVTPDVLIPRPETEHLVEAALEWLRKQDRRRVRVVDVGTGSGCIALSLAAHSEDVPILATDVSLSALGVARRNAEKHGLTGRVRFCQADLLLPLSGPFDLICANLPYGFGETVDAVARHEPRLAIDGGAHGLGLIRRLLAQAVTRLAPGGLLLMEIEETKGAEVQRLAGEFFPRARLEVRRDLAGKERLLWVEM